VGDGTLTIQNGGAVFSGSSDGSVHTSIAEQQGRTGAATVTGTGSSWITNGLVVGGGNSGSLSISGGASVTSTNYLTDVNGTLTAATLTIDPGNFTQTGTVNISDGTSHVGVLTIRNGGNFTGAPTLGVPSTGHTDAVGHAYVQDFGSTWTILEPYFLGAGGG